MNIVTFRLIIFGILTIGLLLLRTFKRTYTPKVKVGQFAPRFTLPDETGTMRSLSEFKGKKIVLYFYPKDGTPGCTQEACGLRDSFDQFKQHDIVVLGVSYDTPESHKEFKEKEHLPFTLLSDAHHMVAHLYGTDQHPLGNLYASRTSFLINEEGKIVHILHDVTPATHANDVLKAFGY